MRFDPNYKNNTPCKSWCIVTEILKTGKNEKHGRLD